MCLITFSGSDIVHNLQANDSCLKFPVNLNYKHFSHSCFFAKLFTQKISMLKYCVQNITPEIIGKTFTFTEPAWHLTDWIKPCNLLITMIRKTTLTYLNPARRSVFLCIRSLTTSTFACALRSWTLFLIASSQVVERADQQCGFFSTLVTYAC
jgi:hypothetical protein